MTELENDRTEQLPITELTAEIVGAYVAHHTVAATDLPVLITTIGQVLARLGQEHTEPAKEKPTPAVPIKRSVRQYEIVCLVCGKAQKMLKRHLATQHDLDPNGYRVIFGLKDDYPMVAPDYAATRSALAKKIGLGRKPEPKKPLKATRKKAARKPAARKG